MQLKRQRSLSRPLAETRALKQERADHLQHCRNCKTGSVFSTYCRRYPAQAIFEYIFFILLVLIFAKLVIHVRDYMLQQIDNVKITQPTPTPSPTPKGIFYGYYKA